MATKNQSYTDKGTIHKQHSRHPDIHTLNRPGGQVNLTAVQRAQLDPGLLTSHEVLQLQRMIGNQAIGGLGIHKPGRVIQRADYEKTVASEMQLMSKRKDEINEMEAVLDGQLAQIYEVDDVYSEVIKGDAQSVEAQKDTVMPILDQFMARLAIINEEVYELTDSKKDYDKANTVRGKINVVYDAFSYIEGHITNLIEGNISSAPPPVVTAAQQQYGRAKNVQGTTGKNKLYLGATKDTETLLNQAGLKQPLKEKRLLFQADPWTWGVNQAFVEGGVDTKANFKLKTHLPNTLLEEGELVDGREFLQRVYQVYGQGKDENPYWRADKNRPTWYSQEIAYLLDKGYTLLEPRRNPQKHPDEFKQVLTPPQ